MRRDCRDVSRRRLGRTCLVLVNWSAAPLVMRTSGPHAAISGEARATIVGSAGPDNSRLCNNAESPKECAMPSPFDIAAAVALLAFFVPAWREWRRRRGERDA